MRYPPARPAEAPFRADDAPADPPVGLHALQPPPQPSPTDNPVGSRGPRAAFATSPQGVVRDSHLPSDGAGAPRHWHQLRGDGDNEVADRQNLRAYRDRGVSSLERQHALDDPSSRAPYGGAWAPARVSTRPSMERISERSYGDDPRAAFAATVGVQPPAERQKRLRSRNNYFFPDGVDGGATRATVPRGPLQPWPDYLALGGSLDNPAPPMRPSTQDVLDQLRRGIEAARIKEAQLDSLLSTPSAQAVPPAPPISAPSLVYANLTILQPPAAALYANAASLNPPPTARPPEQSAFGWQPSEIQGGAPSVWQPPLPLPQQATSSYGAAPQPTSAPNLSAPPPPPSTQAPAY